MRGTELEITNRFETKSYSAFDDGWDIAEELPVIQTQFFNDHAKSILFKNDSPDVGMDYSINVYRGCEHGCAYCRARPYHEYLGFNAGIDFETKIMVKHDAPELLRKTFDSKKWQPQCVMMSGNTDCYQPADRKYQLTRKVLEVFLEYRNPVSILTKNALILRDLDILKELASMNLTSTLISITSLDPDLRRKLEPRTSTAKMKYKAMEELAKADIPVGVMVGPIIPGLNDNEVPNILKQASDNGATYCTHTILRLPFAIKPIFVDWLNKNVPEKSERVLKRVEMIRGGRLNDSKWGTRMTGTGAYADFMHTIFHKLAIKHGLNKMRRPLRTDLFRRPGELF
ncbi:MAG TPA: PA0069 family radical SAM protein [Candidatus Kapabacteria bacterium]|nr:PA0069 family radical SAM protein [Candidatus Kapabacteria bacterium]